MIFCTSSTAHLAKKIKVKKGKCIIKQFSDGEIYVKVLENVKNKPVWVLANTNPPAENILELLFLLDALKRKGAKIKLLIPYFGYARQDKPQSGESCSAKVVCELINKFKPQKIIVLDMHSPRLKKYLKHKNVIPYELYRPIKCKNDIIVAPDKGALPMAKELSKCCGTLVSLKKFRPAHEKVKIKAKKIKGKTIIVDDMISTGGTIIEASKQIDGDVRVLATHGLFSKDALKKIQKSKIKRVYVTNSLPQKPHPKLRVIDISKFIEKLIKNG